MTLRSFGCSFIFGSELADDGSNGPRPTFSKLTWPAHVAQHLGQHYYCHARPGAGNLQITEQVLNQVAHGNSQDLFVIGWTWIDRFDHYDANWNPRDTLSPWRTIMPVDESALARTYYKELHSEYRDKLTTLAHIKLVIDTLNQAQIPFVMTYMDRLIFDNRWNTSPAAELLQQAVKPYMTEFDGMTFLEFSRKNGYPETLKWHPLEQAHRAAAELMIRSFDTQKTSDPARPVLS